MNKVLLIGWDAADWKLIGPLLAKGQMPALKKLIDRGVYGNINTMNPPYSPMLWSSVATGKTPDKHGVLGFIEVTPDGTGIRPITVNSRKSKALWNIMTNQGYKSNVVGWWPSFPAEPINGVMVSDKFHKVNKNPKEKTSILKGTVYPEKLIKEIGDLKMFPQEITEAHILPFIPKASEVNQDKDNGLQAFAKIMAENTSVHAVATNLIRSTSWDFMAVYYDLIDHFCHAFMKFHPPKQKAISQSKYDIYKDAVVGAYRYQDMMLERMVELAGKDTTIIVLSDHGFESGHRRILKMPKYPAAPALEHRQFGIFVAAGPNIKKNEKAFGLGLIDIAPTILHMFNLPVGKDMDGKVALDIFKNPTKVHYIDSWETIEGNFGQHKNNNQTNVFSDEDTLQQLVDLGYIEQPENDKEIAILKTKCELQHNLARVYLGKKDFEMAKSILLELVNTTYPKYDKQTIEGKSKLALKRQNIKVGDPVVDVVPYYMDLLSLSLNQDNFNAAQTYLNKLRNLDKKFELNTRVVEARIMLGKGKPNQALKHLEKAKNKKPNAALWFQIGKIHRKLNHLKEAKQAFINVLKYEIDNAMAHQALAETMVRLNEFEAAAEHALTAIELIKYFPDAHYTLGEALDKLGDFENAKKAYQTASKLKPREHYRAEKAIENINVKDTKFQDKSTSKYKENQIVVVSGLPRTGTSLMMQMLNQGGLKALTDNNRKADKSNPKGYFEHDAVKSIHKDNSWLKQAQNKSVKVVAPLLRFLDPKYRYKVIFMNRDLTEVVKSQQIMIGKDPETLPTKLFDSYKKHLNQVEVWKNKEPGVELIYINYHDVLNHTEETLLKIKTFIGANLNTQAMASCIDTSLYRTKV